MHAPSPSVSDAVQSRRSIRQFLDRPVDKALLRSVLERAQLAPSGGNVQPWEVAILSGPALSALKQKVIAAALRGDTSHADYQIYPHPLPDPWMQRRRDVAYAMYQAMGVARDDKPARAAASLRNLDAFGAPVLLLLHCPTFMGPPQWGDMGIWLQTVMLLLREEGLDSCPQEAWSLYGGLIREELGLGADHILWTGLAIGWRDRHAPVNVFPCARAALDDVVRWFDD